MRREELIQRKEEIKAEMARLRRRLAAAEAGDARVRSVSDLQAQLEALMAEETRLRQQIDRNR